MDHREAVDNQAAERYLLGQMQESEAQAFEMHFFECSSCAEDVHWGGVLAENAKAALPHGGASSAAETAAGPKRAWLNWRPLAWAPACAAAMLACAVVYQANEIAQINKPRTFTAAILRSERGVGSANRIVVPPASRFFVTQVDIPPLQDGSPYASCRLELSDASGRVVRSVDVAAPPSAAPLGIQFPIRGLHSGPYTLTLMGGRDTATLSKIKSYSIELQIQ